MFNKQKEWLVRAVPTWGGDVVRTETWYSGERNVEVDGKFLASALVDDD